MSGRTKRRKDGDGNPSPAKRGRPAAAAASPPSSPPSPAACPSSCSPGKRAVFTLERLLLDRRASASAAAAKRAAAAASSPPPAASPAAAAAAAPAENLEGTLTALRERRQREAAAAERARRGSAPAERLCSCFSDPREIPLGAAPRALCPAAVRAGEAVDPAAEGALRWLLDAAARGDPALSAAAARELVSHTSSQAFPGAREVLAALRGFAAAEEPPPGREPSISPAQASRAARVLRVVSAAAADAPEWAGAAERPELARLALDAAADAARMASAGPLGPGALELLDAAQEALHALVEGCPGGPGGAGGAEEGLLGALVPGDCAQLAYAARRLAAVPAWGPRCRRLKAEAAWSLFASALSLDKREFSAAAVLDAARAFPVFRTMADQKAEALCSCLAMCLLESGVLEENMRSGDSTMDRLVEFYNELKQRPREGSAKDELYLQEFVIARFKAAVPVSKLRQTTLPFGGGTAVSSSAPSAL
eukprot:m51a1_g8112 hypothetical protein (482) ;mRNA; r:128703-130299